MSKTGRGSRGVKRDRTTLVQILRAIVRSGGRHFRGPAKGTDQALHAQLSAVYPPVSDLTLEGMLALDSVDMCASQLFIHAPPIGEGTPRLLPILAAKWDFTSSDPEVCIRVALIDALKGIERGEPAVVRWDRVRSIGYRYETPGYTPGSTHGYYHCQPMTHWSKNAANSELPGVHVVNTSQPAFPLRAVSASTLVVCVLVSLYGLEGLKYLDGPDTTIRDAVETFRGWR